MATVIDSLLITLGLDTSKFNDAQKKAVESLRKTDEQAKKTNDNLQRNTKQTTEGFEKAKDAMVSFGTAALSVGAIVNFASKLQNTNMELYNSSKITGKSAVELQSWGNAVEAAGGKTETFINSIKSIQERLASIPITSDTGLFKFLGPLSSVSGDTGVDVEKHTVNIQKLATAIKKFSEVRGVAEAKTIAQGLGFTEQDFIAMLQGGDALSKLEKHYEEVNKSIEENAELSRTARKEMTDLWTNIEGHGQDALNSLYKAINNLSQNPFFTKLLNFLDKLIDLSIKINPIQLLEKTPEGVWEQFKSNLKETEQMVLDISAPIEPKSTQKASNGNAKIGSRNERNNNPGNITKDKTDFALRHGAIGYDSGGFAIFPDMATGQKALDDLLETQYYNKGQRSISSIIGGVNGQHAYSKTDQSSYIEYLAKKLNINPNQDMSLAQLHGMAGAIPRFEGMTGASATSPMNQNTNNSNTTITIGSIPIHTKATDGVGIAKEIGPAIQNDSLMHFGMVGNR